MDNLTLIKNYSKKLWDDKNINAIDEFFSPNATIHSAYNDGPNNSARSIDEMKSTIQQWFKAFPDMNVNFENFICEDKQVVSQWSATGTHEGEILDHAATQNIIEYNGITIYQVEDQKITAYRAIIDMYNILQQLS